MSTSQRSPTSCHLCCHFLQRRQEFDYSCQCFKLVGMGNFEMLVPVYCMHTYTMRFAVLLTHFVSTLFTQLFQTRGWGWKAEFLYSAVSYFFFFFLIHLAETANKSNVVTASTAIQLLDDRKSPVVAGKFFLFFNFLFIIFKAVYVLHFLF